MLKKTYDWMMSVAGHRHAEWWLALVSFIESSVFPIPPDVMLVPMVLADRRKAWRYAAICTFASVLGGFLGYAIGYFLYETIGKAVFAFYHLTAQFDKFQAMFNEWGAWIVLIKGMTPIPFKLVTIASGVTKLDLLVFTIASIGSRGVRFFLVAGLLWKYGEPIRDFIERRLTLVTTTFVVALVGGFFALKLI